MSGRWKAVSSALFFFGLALFFPDFQAPAADGVASPETATGDQMNTAAGATLWAETTDGDPASLWEESADGVAQRLRLPRESKTAFQSSYRLYPKPDYRLFGARPYSIALYAKGDKANEFSIVFANGGDFFTDRENLVDYHGVADNPKVLDAFAKRLRSDEATIRQKLTEVLGPPTQGRAGARPLDYEVRQWEWKDCVILLATPQEKYVMLRIVPKEQAKRERMRWADLKELLGQRIIHRENGDVLIGEIPMVDQGPKGYCVPATWERYLRYLDIPADMYVLAQFAGTGLGDGGTNPVGMAAVAESLATGNDLRIDSDIRPIIFATVKDSIDRGLPFMWVCRAGGDDEKWISEWTERRKKTDWDEWVAFVKSRPPVTQPIPGGGHMRMIVGYNATTREIAISDSWGEKYIERWMPFDVFEQLSGSILYKITW